ncbi:MAG TPA: hypothetical protein VF411_02655 [Bacteroidia bacterium]
MPPDDLSIKLTNLYKLKRKKLNEDIDSENLDVQEHLKGLEAKRYSSDTYDRKWLAIWTACIVSLWLWGVMCILKHNTNRYELSDNVLVALLGTTTLNVLGLSFIVLRGHFNSSIKKKE